MQSYWPQCNSMGTALSKVSQMSKVTKKRSAPGRLKFRLRFPYVGPVLEMVLQNLRR